jgi:hypothetical protein
VTDSGISSASKVFEGDKAKEMREDETVLSNITGEEEWTIVEDSGVESWDLEGPSVESWISVPTADTNTFSNESGDRSSNNIN